jgi:hypothetical protein
MVSLISNESDRGIHGGAAEEGGVTMMRAPEDDSG